MSNSQTPENGGALATPNGADNGAWRSRVADLLDDVTVTAVPAAGAAAPAADAVVPPAPAVAASPAPQSAAAAPWADAPLPPDPYEPPAWAIREISPSRDVAPPMPAPAPPSADEAVALSPPAAPAPAAASEPVQVDSPVGSPLGENVTPVRTSAPIPQALSIRGRGDGLAIEIGKGVWAEIMAALAERLEQSASFFRAARIALDVGPRPVMEDELQQLIKLVERYDMTIGAVRTSTERTFQSALALGLTVTLESADGAAVADATPRSHQCDDHRLFCLSRLSALRPSPQAQRARPGHRRRQPRRRGHQRRRHFGVGTLTGFAHAGANGNRRAIVAALDLEPTQLRIADVTTIGPDPKMGQPGKWFWNRSRTKRPEIARIVNQVILLDEWDATRPGGLVSLRRGAVKSNRVFAIDAVVANDEADDRALPMNRPMNPASKRPNDPMTGTVITVTSGKGGVGKTTTTANLSAALATMASALSLSTQTSACATLIW